VGEVEPSVDYAAAKDHVHDVIAQIAPVDSVERFEGLGVHVIQEYGRFISKTEVQAGDTIIEARRFVVATGSGPFVPPIPGLEDVTYYTNENDEKIYWNPLIESYISFTRKAKNAPISYQVDAEYPPSDMIRAWLYDQVKHVQ
jgi:hypothetical protein